MILCESMIVPTTQRMRLLAAMGILTVSYTVVATGSVFFGILLANILQDGWDSARVRFAQLVEIGDVYRGCLYSLAIVVLFVFIRSISQKLGPGVLVSWLLGRYHQPREERCVFMFLDLRGSTGLAERLGDLRFSTLIRDLFADMTPALLNHGARVSHFIGDEVVLYWPIRKGREPDAAFARCFFAIQDLLDSFGQKYKERYGAVPKFKAGAHYGNVIATDVGQIKSEIVFHGDVLNVASRLQQLCNEESSDFLVSGELAPAVRKEAGMTLEEKGDKQLKGRGQPVRVFAVGR